MPKDEHAKAPSFGRSSQFDALITFLEGRLDRLVDLSIEVAKTNGYAPFTTTIRAAWVEAIVSVTDSLRTYLAGETSGPGGPHATLDYGKDPRFKRMRQIARQHRSLGITLQMYVGLFKHFRNLYLAELAARPEGLAPDDAARVRDFFDETELSITADWNDKSDHVRLRELQERTRAVTLDKDRYFAVFESLRNAAFLLDRRGHLVNANQASAELFLGQDAQAGDIIYLRSMRLRKNSLQKVVDQIMARPRDLDDPLWLETLDGPRCFDIRTRRLHDAVDNTALGHVVLLNDVTAHQRRADEALQAERGMSRFLATMSHEIRTPLHSVLGAAELLRTADEDGADTYLDVIEGAGKALLQTLTNVLDYSKFENAPPVPSPTNTDLHAELQAFTRFARIGRDASQTRLDLAIDPSVPNAALIDWSKTQQVLSNLVSNALKMDTGTGVDIAVKCETGEALRLHFTVRDHGPGIPESAALALSRPFEETRARDTGDGGSGLGLAISHYLVTAMGGQLGYQNRSDGAEVWFSVPMSPADRVAGQADILTDPDHALSEPPHLCLLVDDDPVGAIVTTRQLERAGLVVTRAASFSDAQARAAETSFDVFVVDYLLPDGDGPTLVKALKHTTQRPARFLALTANVEALAGRAEDFDEVLAKPASQVSLATAVFGKGAANPAPIAAVDAEYDGLQGLAPDTVLAMIDTFSNAWSGFRDLITSQGTQAPNQDLALTAHRLAGSCTIFGLTELTPSLRQLEAQCLHSNAPVPLAPFQATLDRDLSDLASWQRLTATRVPG